MTIRNEQLHALSVGMTNQFTKRLVAHLTEAYPALAGGRNVGSLDAFVRSNFARAQAAGIETELEVWRFVSMIYLGAEETATPVDAVLADPQLSGAEKVDAIASVLAPHFRRVAPKSPWAAVSKASAT